MKVTSRSNPGLETVVAPIIHLHPCSCFAVSATTRDCDPIKRYSQVAPPKPGRGDVPTPRCRNSFSASRDGEYEPFNYWVDSLRSQLSRHRQLPVFPPRPSFKIREVEGKHHLVLIHQIHGAYRQESGWLGLARIIRTYRWSPSRSHHSFFLAATRRNLNMTKIGHQILLPATLPSGHFKIGKNSSILCFSTPYVTVSSALGRNSRRAMIRLALELAAAYAPPRRQL